MLIEWIVYHCHKAQLMKRHNRGRGQYHDGDSGVVAMLIERGSASLSQGSVSQEARSGKEAILLWL